MGRLIAESVGRNRGVIISTFALGGILCGIALALSLHIGGDTAKTSLGASIGQGIVGGLAAAVLIALMIQVTFAKAPAAEASAAEASAAEG